MSQKTAFKRTVFLCVVLILSVMMFSCAKEEEKKGTNSVTGIKTDNNKIIVEVRYWNPDGSHIEQYDRRTGQKLCIQNYAHEDVVIDGDFILQRRYKDSTEYYDVELIAERSEAEDIELKIAEKIDIDFKWEDFYGRLEDGSYRIVVQWTGADGQLYYTTPGGLNINPAD